MKLNIGCGSFYAQGWTNTDVAQFGDVKPDVVQDRLDRLPFGDGSAEQVYLGHVLEHTPWPDVPVLLGEVMRVLTPGGELLVVGPDVNRATQALVAGTRDWDWWVGVIEDDLHYQQLPPGYHGARHWWNCYEARVVRALEGCGFAEVVAVPVVELDALSARWPIVSGSPEQCAAKARKP